MGCTKNDTGPRGVETGVALERTRRLSGMGGGARGWMASRKNVRDRRVARGGCSVSHADADADADADGVAGKPGEAQVARSLAAAETHKHSWQPCEKLESGLPPRIHISSRPIRVEQRNTSERGKIETRRGPGVHDCSRSHLWTADGSTPNPSRAGATHWLVAAAPEQARQATFGQ